MYFGHLRGADRSENYPQMLEVLHVHAPNSVLHVGVLDTESARPCLPDLHRNVVGVEVAM